MQILESRTERETIMGKHNEWAIHKAMHKAWELEMSTFFERIFSDETNEYIEYGWITMILMRQTNRKRTAG